MLPLHMQIQTPMKFSKNYIFYPANKALEQAIELYINTAPALALKKNSSDDWPIRQDTFSYAERNLEQYKYEPKVLESARLFFESTLTEDQREQVPLAWAAAQDRLGNILAALGQHHSDTALLQKSIEAFNYALEERSQEKVPQDWASTQNNLGTVLLILGQQENSSKVLKKSVDAYTNALQGWTRDTAPVDWASTMNKLGLAFHAHGKLLKGSRTLEKSVVAYKNAVTEWDVERDSFALAMTQNNRGAVLQYLGESEESPQRLEEAIGAYEKALNVLQEQQLPIHLAVMIKVNVGTARRALSEITKDPAMAQQAADEFELIIEIFSNTCSAQCLEFCQEQLEKSLALVEDLGGEKRW